MTALDMLVIVVGLLFGYRLVSNYLSPNTGDEQPRRRNPSDPQNQRTERGQWEGNWEPLTPRAPTWFEVLDVAEDADLAEIERAYRTKMSQYHPDKVAQLGEDIRQLAEAKSKDINAAYETARRLRGMR